MKNDVFPIDLGHLRALGAGLFIAITAIFSTATQAVAVNCNIETRAIELDVRGLQLTIRCLNNAIRALDRENARLKQRATALEALVGQLPAPWSNADGVISQDIDRPISKATFVLSARSTGGANALPVDQRVLQELCDQRGGCSLTIANKQLSRFNKDPTQSTIIGPCRFTYTAKTGEWAVSAGCGADGASAGVDGDGGLGAEAANSAQIAVAGGGCFLSDSGLAKLVEGDAGLASDRSKGLFLIAMPTRQDGASRRFQCELAFE